MVVVLRKVTQRFKGATRRYLARRSRNDDFASVLEYRRERDPLKNAETSPPEDERVELRCLWAAELYTPSQVDKLLGSLRKLGWDHEDLPGRESPASWVKTSRLFSEGWKLAKSGYRPSS